MKHCARAVALGTFLLNTATFAANPAPGLYAGIMGGGSYSPRLNFAIVNPFTGVYTPGKLGYKAGGNGGGQLGYRICKFRLEGEVNFNYIPFDKLTISNFYIRNNVPVYGVGMKGETQFIAGLFNAYYEMYQPDGSIYGLVPYVGVGVGFANVQSRAKFYFNQVLIAGSQEKDSNSTAIAQAILGASYFLDDFTTVGLDVRYIGSRRINVLNERLQVLTLNVILNFSFDTPEQG